jgi:predicted nuclease with TOPRIM domain
MLEDTTVQSIFSAFAALCVAVIGFFTRRVVQDVEGLKQERHECKLELEKFKTEVARDYSKDVNVQSSLNRIHDRIDRLPQEIASMMERKQ